MDGRRDYLIGEVMSRSHPLADGSTVGGVTMSTFLELLQGVWCHPCIYWMRNLYTFALPQDGKSLDMWTNAQGTQESLTPWQLHPTPQTAKYTGQFVSTPFNFLHLCENLLEHTGERTTEQTFQRQQCYHLLLRMTEILWFLWRRKIEIIWESHVAITEEQY